MHDWYKHKAGLNQNLGLNISLQDLAVGRGHKVQLKEAEGFASTYYNIPSTVVQRVAVYHQGKVSNAYQSIEHARFLVKEGEESVERSSVVQVSVEIKHFRQWSIISCML